MTLEQVKTLRDKYYNALLDLDLKQLDHSIGDASYSHDTHRTSLQESFKFWDDLYNKKLSGGTTARLNKKAV